MDGPASDAMLKLGRFFTKWDQTDDGRAVFREGGRKGDIFYRDRWSHDKVVRSTHGVNCTGLLLLEGVRQGRHHHLGVPADRLPLGGPGQPRVRAAGLPARRGLLLVHLLAHPGPVPVRPRRAGGDVPRGQGPAGGPGAGVRRRRGGPGAAPPLPAGPRQGRPGPRLLAGGDRNRRRRARQHDQDLRSGPVRRLLADPGDVHGLARGGHPLHPADRRGDDVLLRLVRRPSRGQPAGLRRPDRRPGIRGLVGRHAT